MKHMKFALFIVTILMVGLMAAACGPQSTPTAEPAVTSAPQGASSGNTSAATPAAATTEAPTDMSIGKFTAFDPAVITDKGDLNASGYVYQTLVKSDGGKVDGLLATSWLVSSDGLEYTFTLQQGVVFQDGSSFNAEAVIANFNRWFDPNDPLHGTQTYQGWADNFLGFKGETKADGTPKSFFDGVEKVDDNTVLIHLNRPEPKLLDILAMPYFAFASPFALQAAGDSYGTTPESVAGTGPYKVATWTDTSLTLAPNSMYSGEVPAQGMEFSIK